MKIRYKDFSSSDYGVILSRLISSNLFPDIERVLHDALQIEKYKRLKALSNKKVTEHGAKFGKYKNKQIPKHVIPEYARFAKYMDNLKKQLDKHIAIMEKMGLFQDKPEGKNDGI